jgi:hypothetical protein
VPAHCFTAVIRNLIFMKKVINTYLLEIDVPARLFDFG